MDHLINDDNSIMKRRYSNRLKMAGRAIIIFGLWQSLQVIILFILNYDTIASEVMEGVDADVSSINTIYVALVIAIILVVGFPFLVNLYMGLSAMGEAKGKKKTPVYLVICALSFIFSLSSIFLSNKDNYIELVIASLIVDITFCIACIDVIYSSIRLRKYRKIKEKEV